MDYKAVAAKKQAERLARIPPEWRIDVSKYEKRHNVLDVPRSCGILSEREIKITEEYDAVAIVAGIKAGEFSAEEVTVAFCKRAAIAQQLVNCLTEIMFHEAIEQAKALDLYQKQHGAVKGPLHGLPISLKDSFKVRGHDATIGLLHFTNKPIEEESILVETLRSLGAVLHCKTNVPQTMMTVDSENNIWGRTLNPNKSLTSGGSTGGEGALIALRGSVAGIGTDVAGSNVIRSALQFYFECHDGDVPSRYLK